jgi:LacI family transcriptional regulator
MNFRPKGIKDIAKALQISPSTVSRALTDQYGVSEETRRLVIDYAEKINYRANPSALGLKKRRNYSIGVVVCEIANNFFSQAIDGIDAIAYDKGYHVIVTQSHESFERELINIQHLASSAVDGLIVSLSAETLDLSCLKSLSEQGLPIVFFDRVPDNIDAHKVVANNRKGAFEATRHLVNSGCKYIAHLTCSSRLSIARERMIGYRQALLNAGFPFREQYVEHCDYGGKDQVEIEAAIGRLMCLPHPPDGIFVANDKLSTGALNALKQYDGDRQSTILLSGFTNSNLVGLFERKLIPVRQKAYEMGQKATELLIQLIESKSPVTDFETCMLDTELIGEDAAIQTVEKNGLKQLLQPLYI